jgi:predicted nucleotidyltransferase
MDIYEKSFSVLKKITLAQKEHNFSFVLIGGWAVWVYSRYLKSKDIDIIIKPEDFFKLKNFFINLGFSETGGKHLNKKGFVKLFEDDKIEIDVYTEKIAHTDVKQILKNSVKKKINGIEINVASITDLFILKVIALLDRIGSAKGEKDISDLIALLEHYEKIDFNIVIADVGKDKLKYIFKVIFSNYKITKKFYNIELGKYKKIKLYLEEVLGV